MKAFGSPNLLTDPVKGRLSGSRRSPTSPTNPQVGRKDVRIIASKGWDLPTTRRKSTGPREGTPTSRPEGRRSGPGQRGGDPTNHPKVGFGPMWSGRDPTNRPEGRCSVPCCQRGGTPTNAPEGGVRALVCGEEHLLAHPKVAFGSWVAGKGHLLVNQSPVDGMEGRSGPGLRGKVTY